MYFAFKFDCPPHTGVSYLILGLRRNLRIKKKKMLLNKKSRYKNILNAMPLITVKSRNLFHLFFSHRSKHNRMSCLKRARHSIFAGPRQSFQDRQSRLKAKGFYLLQVKYLFFSFWFELLSSQNIKINVISRPKETGRH